MTKTKIRLAAAFSSLVLVGLGLFSYQSYANVPLLKTANTSAFTANGHHTIKSPSKGTAGTVSSGVASSSPTASATATAPVTNTQKAAAKTSNAAATNGARSAAVADNIASGQALYINPNSNISNGARSWAATNLGDAVRMNRLANTPMANWFGDFSGSNVQAVVNNYVSAASSSGTIPEVVAYNIPQRDCGSYSAGGASSAAAYQSWISSLATGIGMRQAIVIVEPDALAGMDCLSASDQASRLQLLSYAVDVLQTKTKAAVYLDAGNSGWQALATIASRLKSAGVSEATGFSLNVSNFETTASNVTYGTALAGLVGGKHFVIDTSRNGNGPSASVNSWCNPTGRAFGNSPTTQTGRSLVDAYLWIKGPGESDGACGPDQSNTSAPSAGGWWPQYALMLEQNSGW